MSAGYSQIPLAKTLNLRDGRRVWFEDMPESVQDEIGEYALDLIFVADPDEGADALHIFVRDPAGLEERLANFRRTMAKDGHVWVSWPKPASGVAGDIDESDVRAAGLAAGFVDTKQCEVDETWSGLKFVIPKDDR